MAINNVKTTVGRIVEDSSSPNKHTWIVANYCQLPQKPDESIESPVFSSSSYIWHFEVCPKGRAAANFSKTTPLFLVGQRHINLPICWKISLLPRSGVLQRTGDNTNLNVSTRDYSVECLLIEQNDSMHNDFFFPEGRLTVVCETSFKEKASDATASSRTGQIPRFEKLAQDFKTLLDCEDGSDVTVHVQNQQFRVHRCILQARTPVFSAMFTHDMSEKTSGIVEIEDCEPHIFKLFLQYVYSGNVEELTPEQACSLYEIADKYQVEELKAGCLQCIKDGVSVETFCDIITLAFKHDEKELVKLATEFFKDNIKEILLTLKWQAFLLENTILGNELLIIALCV